MNQKEILLFYSYIYNQRCSMEDDIHVLQNNIRFRKPDVVDCMELACAIQRLETFTETTNHLIELLKLG